MVSHSLLLVVFFHLLVAPTASLPGCCVGGTCGFLADGFCYAEITTSSLSWPVARDECKSLYHPASDLAFPMGQDSYLEFFRIVYETGVSLWIGGSNLLNSEVFRFLSGDIIPNPPLYADAIRHGEVYDGSSYYTRDWSRCLRLVNDLGKMWYEPAYCTDLKEAGGSQEKFLCMVDITELDEGLAAGASVTYPEFNRRYFKNSIAPIISYCDFDSIASEFCPNDTLCPNNCSGNGECWFESNNPGPVCSCDSGWVGRDCSWESDCELSGTYGVIEGILYRDRCYFDGGLSGISSYQTWQNGRTLCKDLHGASDYPVFIHSKDNNGDVAIEEEFVAQVFGEGFWLGLHDITAVSNGWIDGSVETDVSIPGRAGDNNWWPYHDWYPVVAYQSRLCWSRWGPDLMKMRFDAGGVGWTIRDCELTVGARPICQAVLRDADATTVSAPNEWLNVRYVISEYRSYCDISQHPTTCPHEFYCNENPDLEGSCSFLGTCEFNAVSKLAECNCVPPNEGHDCRRPSWCADSDYYNGHCYREYGTEYRNFWAARDRCKSWHGAADLAWALGDDRTHKFLEDAYMLSSTSHWVGGTNAANFSEWRWLNGEVCEFSENIVTDFRTKKRFERPCLAFWQRSYYIDVWCTLTNRFLCSIDVEENGLDYSEKYPWLNVRYYERLDGEDWDDPPLVPYCDIGTRPCPDSFWCQGIPGRAGCSNNGDCLFDPSAKKPYCGCDSLSFGEFCESTGETCLVLGKSGYLWQGGDVDVCFVRSPDTFSWMGWQEGRDFCKAWHPKSDLAVLDTADAYTFFYEMFGDHIWWLGLSDIAEDGRWRWVNGKLLSDGYVGWDLNEPTGEHCVDSGGIREPRYTDRTWNDVDCFFNRPVICAVPLAPESQEAAAWKNVSYDPSTRKSLCDSETLLCPPHLIFECPEHCVSCSFDALLGPTCECSNVTLYGPDCRRPDWCHEPGDLYADGTCFRQLTQQLQTWHDARSYCKENWHLAADLPVGNTPDRMQLILQEEDLFSFSWLGAQDVVEEGTILWITNEFVTPSPGLSLETGDDWAACVFMTDSTTWEERSCEAKLPFFCSLHVDDVDSLTGSVSAPWMNTRFHTQFVWRLDEYQELEYPSEFEIGFNYCNFSQVDCPSHEVFFCSESCDIHGSCYFDSDALGPRCRCDSGWVGEDCSIPDSPPCYVLGLPGKRLGNDCFFLLDGMEASSWHSARDQCKEFHSAADLPVLSSETAESFVRGHFPMKQWIGLGTLPHSSVFQWVDGAYLSETYNPRPRGLRLTPAYQDVTECVSVDSRIRYPPSGWESLTCLDTLPFVCVVDLDDINRWDSIGASNPFKNIRYDYYRDDDSWYMVVTPYCDFSQIEFCPEEFSCNANCNGHGECVFSHEKLVPECQCQEGYPGNDCGFHEWCDPNEGRFYWDGVCYWEPEDTYWTNEPTRDHCRSQHPAAHLPIIESRFHWDVLHDEFKWPYDEGLWIGITNLILDDGHWSWVDGTPLAPLTSLHARRYYLPLPDPEGSELPSSCVVLQGWGWIYPESTDCDDYYHALCALNMEDVDSGVDGSVISPWLNVRFAGLEAYDLRMSCDFTNVPCPDRFLCGGAADGCGEHRHCIVDQPSIVPTCVCDAGWYGDDCELEAPSCVVGEKIGFSYNGACYLKISEEEVTAAEARDECKSFHSAAVLPILNPQNVSDFVTSAFKRPFWIAATSLPSVADGVEFWWLGGEAPVLEEDPNWATLLPRDSWIRHCVFVDPNGDWRNADCQTVKKSFVCEVLLSDIPRVNNGSLVAERNVRISFFDDENDLPSTVYCNFDLYPCPTSFVCESGCVINATCVFDEIILAGKCVCLPGFSGSECDAYVPCEVGGVSGLPATSPGGNDLCYFQGDQVERTWNDARIACKQVHSAADLAVFSDSDLLVELYLTYGRFWTGYSRVHPSAGLWASVDGVEHPGFVSPLVDFGDCAAAYASYSIFELESLEGLVCDEELLPILCYVDLTADGDRETGGSRNPVKNVLFDFEHGYPYCNIEEYLDCPAAFWCNELNIDHRASCLDLGSCSFDQTLHVPYCDCDDPMMGGFDCSIPVWCPGLFFNGSCYYQPLGETSLDWVSARTACKNWTIAADLPVVTSDEIRMLLRNEYGVVIWVGATDAVAQGSWEWVSHDPFDVSAALVMDDGGNEADCLALEAIGSFGDYSCSTEMTFTCVVHKDDWFSAQGSSRLWSNVRYWGLDETDGLDLHPYCDIGAFDCPASFDCGIGCETNGECVFDTYNLESRCDCNGGFMGVDCGTIAPPCAILGRGGIHFEDACYVTLNEDFVTWSDARDQCKEWHAAADLPVVNATTEEFVMSTYGSGHWLGLSTLFFGDWAWIDGTPDAGSFALGSGDCGWVDSLLQFPPDGLLDVDCDNEGSLAKFVCVVQDADEFNDEEGASNPEKNVRYDFVRGVALCDVAQFDCPERFPSCPGNGDCSGHGDCHFNYATLQPHCNCSIGYTGFDCGTLGECPGVSLGGACYQPSLGRLSWSGARSACKHWHNAADLPVVLSDEMRIFLRDEFGEVWVGATDALEEGSWEWVTHEPFSVPALTEDGGTEANCLYLEGSGMIFNDLACKSDKSFVCVVLDADFSQTTGSSKLWSNVRYWSLDDTDEYDPIAYCDIDLFDCPNEFWCFGTPGLRAGCSDQGDCVFNSFEYSPKCECDSGFTGHDCSIVEQVCQVDGSDGLRNGTLYDGACYVTLNEDLGKWSDARDQCKEWHASSDLPVLSLSTEEFLLATFGSGYWMGLTSLLSEEWAWVDGTVEPIGFVHGSGECSWIASGLLYPPSGLVGAHCDESGSLAKFVCVVEIVDVDSDTGASNAKKNVRYDFTHERPYCDVERFTCPGDFSCRDDCHGNGNCLFDELRLEPYCNCSSGWGGIYCASPGNCPGLHTDGVCYYPPAPPLSWSAARTKCKESWGSAADLAVPGPNATDLLRATFQNVDFWLGATDAVEEGVWNWITHDSLQAPMGVTLDLTTGEDSDCLLWTNGGDVWTDVSCVSPQSYVCALRDVDSGSESGSSISYQNVRYFSIESGGIPAIPFCDIEAYDCPDEFYCDGARDGCLNGGSCRFEQINRSPVCDCPIGRSRPFCSDSYTPCQVTQPGGLEGVPYPPGSEGLAVEKCFIVPEGDRRSTLAEGLNWAQAREFCKSWHAAAELPMARNSEELSFLLDTFGIGIWLGMTDILDAGEWLWNDGSDVSLPNWAGAIPNDDGDERCGALWSDTNGFVAQSCLADSARTVCVVSIEDFDRADECAVLTSKNVRYDFHDGRSYCNIDLCPCPDEFYCSHLQDCNDHGDCEFDSVNEAPKCVCNDGWTGAFCSLSSNETKCADISDLGVLQGPPSSIPVLEGYNGVFVIEMSNPTSVMLPRQVLIQLDTTRLCCDEPARIQSDCSDMRFYAFDGETATPIRHFYEFGCCSPTTRVWLEIPDGPLDILMYHENPNAEDTSARPVGQFVTMVTDPGAYFGWGEAGCDPQGDNPESHCIGMNSLLSHRFGWTPWETMRGKFVKLQGESVSTLGHTHSLVGSTEPERLDSVVEVDAMSVGALSKPLHSHSFSTETVPGEYNPRYQETLFIATGDRVPFPLPPSSLVMFEKSSALDGSPRFNAYHDFDDIFPLGTDLAHFCTIDEQEIVRCDLNGLKDGGADVHNHTLRLRSLDPSGWDDSFQDVSCRVTDLQGVETRAAPHGHELVIDPDADGIVTAEASSLPVHYSALFAEARNGLLLEEFDLEPHVDSMWFLATSVPPLGWEAVDHTKNRYLRGASNGAGRSEASSTSGTHSHAVAFSTAVDDQSVPCDWSRGGSVRSLPDHVHLFEDEVVEATVELPFESLVLIQRFKDARALPVDFVDGYTFYWACDGIDRSFLNVTCNGHGECVGNDFCQCFYDKNYFGEFCSEHITTAKFSEDNILLVSWEVPLGDLLQGYSTSGRLVRSDTSDSDSVVCDAVVVLDEHMPSATCMWLMSEDRSHSTALQITFGAIPELDGDLITVIPVQNLGKNQQQVQITVAPFEQTVEKGVVLWEVVGSVVGVLFLVILISAVVVALLVSAVCYVKRASAARQKVLNVLELDILLEEARLLDENESFIKSLTVDSDVFTINRDDITLGKELGRGGSGATVYLAELVGAGEVAYKQFNLAQLVKDEQSFKEFQNELKIMYACRHPHVLGCFGMTMKKPKIGVVLEFCSNGDVKAFLKKYLKVQARPYALEGKIRLLEEIASAMAYLHARTIWHRDLKAENVLVDDSEKTKLMDFGLSKAVGAVAGEQTKAIGTSFYMAPEVILGEDYDEKIDVFSYGIMAYTMLSDDWEPYGPNAEYVEFKVAASPFFRPKIAVIAAPLWMKELARSCWDHSPEKRPSFSAILQAFKTSRELRDPVGIYMKTEGVADEDAEDFLLKLLTMDELHAIAKLQYSEQSLRSRAVEFWSETETGDSVRLTQDEDLLRLMHDSLITVKFLDESGASGEETKTTFDCDEGTIEVFADTDDSGGSFEIAGPTPIKVPGSDITGVNCVVHGDRVLYTIMVHGVQRVSFTIAEADSSRCSELLDGIVHSGGDVITIECREGILEVRTEHDRPGGEFRLIHKRGDEPEILHSADITSIDVEAGHGFVTYRLDWQNDGEGHFEVTLDEGLRDRFEALLDSFLKYADGVSVDCDEGMIEISTTGKDGGHLTLITDEVETCIHTSSLKSAKVVDTGDNIRYDLSFYGEEGEVLSVRFHLEHSVELALQEHLEELLGWSEVLKRLHGQ